MPRPKKQPPPPRERPHTSGLRRDQGVVYVGEDGPVEFDNVVVGEGERRWVPTYAPTWGDGVLFVAEGS